MAGPEKTGTAKASTAKASAAKTSGAKAGGAKAARAGAAAEGPGGRGLKIHHLRPAPGAHAPRTRVGRGEASKGKTAGRGTKGTRARGGVPENFEGGQMPLHRRVPKLRGFSNLAFKTTYQVVNTGRLAELYPEGGDVTPEDLVAKGAVRSGKLVKVLGTGDTPVALRVSAHAFSASAREKITAAGGTVTEL
jgi:large subunit ribosomal protein L15